MKILLTLVVALALTFGVQSAVFADNHGGGAEATAEKMKDAGKEKMKEAGDKKKKDGEEEPDCE